MEKLVNYFQGKEVSSILEVGTGGGDFIAVLRDVFPEAEIAGIDPDTESLLEVVKKHPDVSFMLWKYTKYSIIFAAELIALREFFTRNLLRKNRFCKWLKRLAYRFSYILNNLESNLVTDEGELEIKVEKMKQHLERIKDLSEYEIFKPQIEVFRRKAKEHGFQPATRIVFVGIVE